MKRPESHEIQHAWRETQLQAAFESLGWTVNPEQTTTGPIFEIEVFRNREATPLTHGTCLRFSKSVEKPCSILDSVALLAAQVESGVVVLPHRSLS